MWYYYIIYLFIFCLGVSLNFKLIDIFFFFLSSKVATLRFCYQSNCNRNKINFSELFMKRREIETKFNSNDERIIPSLVEYRTKRDREREREGGKSTI